MKQKQSNMSASGVKVKPQYRRKMTQQVIRILKREITWSTFEGFSKVLHLAKQLEACLYEQACSFEAYQDKLTLKRRLDVALATMKSHVRIQDDSHELEEVCAPLTTATSGTMGASALPHVSNSSILVGQQPCHAQTPRLNRGLVAVRDSMELSTVSNRNSSTCASSTEARTVIDRSYASRPQTTRAVGLSHDNMVCRPVLDSAIPAGSTQSQIESTARINLIRHQQGRLLSLHHAAKCKHIRGHCPISMDCADMKALWKHLESCKDKNCKVPSCFSSREILSHHLKCVNQVCPVCAEVHATVKKSQNRRIQDLNQHRLKPVASGYTAAAYKCLTPVVCAVAVAQDQPLEDSIDLPVIVLRSEDIVGTALPLMG